MADPLLREGELAPDFELPDQSGTPVRLSSFRGRRAVVLYFYPKDDTPGCTTEACGFRDDHAALAQLDAEVLGVSFDSVASHQKFVEKYGLNFRILSDEEKEVGKRYGATGLGALFAKRITYLIDKEGKIAKVFPKVSPAKHAAEVRAALRALE